LIERVTFFFFFSREEDDVDEELNCALSGSERRKETKKQRKSLYTRPGSRKECPLPGLLKKNFLFRHVLETSSANVFIYFR